MNIIQSMINEKLGEVRIIKSEDGNVMNTQFCAVDVCRALGYPENSIRMIIKRCNDVNKIYTTDSLGREQSMNFIKLPDIFRLIDRSNKPEAVEFQNWLYNDVLPSLYKFGTYTVEDHIDNPDFNNPIFDPKDIGDYVDCSQNITSYSYSENDGCYDMRPLLKNIGVLFNEMITPIINNQRIMYEQQQNINNEIIGIKSEVQEIKQMIIPATIVKDNK